jgi:CRISPR/Cas system-associated exonuclease Cas4 (RecB family)
MPLTDDFQFSQVNLQDYADCPRRFQLRYLLELAWPAVEAEPADVFEARIRDGEAFHRMVQQHVLGVLPAGIAPAPGSNLAAWWEGYLASPPPDLPLARYPEVTLSAPLGEHRLMAKVDLIAIEPGRRAIIVDWKTSARRPGPGRLIERLQTRVYRYLLVRAGAALNDSQPLRPEQVEMIYWFANSPDEPQRLRYDATQFEADGRYLTELAAEIAQRADAVFSLTDDARRCLFCAYRSLCRRGVEAGDMDAAYEAAGAAEEISERDWATSFDFEQIGEIAF